MNSAIYLDDEAKKRCSLRAQELGVTPDQYRLWESGKRVPEVETAMLKELDDKRRLETLPR